MTEASKDEYFVDGFLLRHFDVWPDGLDKNNLFEEQKIFLVYLMGCIPSLDNWQTQVNYKIDKKKIEELEEIDIPAEEFDLAKLQGRDISDLKKVRLKLEKERLLYELNKKYGIKNEETIPERPEGLPEPDQNPAVNKGNLWDLLNGKGLIDKRKK